ncbi:ROK family glucokinase [Planosporangium sp. 12N6]|uniref:ROK family glucokinase n=1 Tax=Planosporangium spinosum TaxID=3402278 RepID=UPI003CF888FA
MSLTIGVDIGGTKVLGGIVGPDGEVLAEARRPTPAQDPAGTATMICEVITELTAIHPVEAIGIGAAGWINAERSVIMYAPNLAWRDEPLRDEIARRFNVPVVVENDANVAAWAEFRFGAARDASDSMVLYTVGTGIGSGIVMGGELIRGAHGVAAELGHVRVVPDGLPCGCKRHGCLEQYASGTALVRYARATAKEAPDKAERLLALAGGMPEAITGPMVTTAGKQGDPAAIAAFEQVGYWLGNSMVDMVQILDPQVIVVGGGVVEAGDLLIRPTEASYRDNLEARGALPVAEVHAAQMGNLAGVVGAADLARR